MTERDKQTEFLKQLLVLSGSKSERELQTRMQDAHHNEKCVRYALTLVALIGGFAVCGLGYSAVLHPEFFDSSMPTLVKLFCAIGLGSLLCMIVFVGCWLWYRSISNRLFDECRELVFGLIQARLKSHPQPVFVQTLDFSLPVPPTESERSSAVG